MAPMSKASGRASICPTPSSWCGKGRPITASALKSAWIPFTRRMVSAAMTATAVTCLPKRSKLLLETGTPYVIRQKMPLRALPPLMTRCSGSITIENTEIEDQILLKSDGYPTYNFANVIDDHLMHITHVVRGCEYLTSTPKYNLLYEAFGWEIPIYVHLPLIMGKNAEGLGVQALQAAWVYQF